MAKTHHYELDVTWIGNTGTGTSGYREYDRAHDVSADGKPTIAGSADPRSAATHSAGTRGAFGGLAVAVPHVVGSRAVLAGGHRRHRIHRPAVGHHGANPDGGGYFTEVVLRPVVEIADDRHREALTSVHERAHHLCFIANSVNFDVRCEAQVSVAESA